MSPEGSPRSDRRKKSINLEPGHFSMVRGTSAGLNFAEAINQISPDLRSSSSFPVENLFDSGRNNIEIFEEERKNELLFGFDLG